MMNTAVSCCILPWAPVGGGGVEARVGIRPSLINQKTFSPCLEGGGFLLLMRALTNILAVAHVSVILSHCGTISLNILNTQLVNVV